LFTDNAKNEYVDEIFFISNNLTKFILITIQIKNKKNY
jgi:hypothetical protein